MIGHASSVALRHGDAILIKGKYLIKYYHLLVFVVLIELGEITNAITLFYILIIVHDI
ncbi:MAG: hypothetical protein ACMG6E_10405 [Candidatus Roizmanbacteria bacterium]